MSETRELKPTCGIVMPISATDGCSADHWAEVLSLFEDSAEAEGFEVKLVSEAEEAGIIHKRIVQNIFNSDVIICDVSGKNPNVMFELGLRLAFDKPTVVIKDNKTDYSFDTSPFEHLGYPRDLRFSKIVDFKEALRKKLKAALNGDNSNSFLKSFGEFQTVSLESTEVPAQKYLVDAVDDLKGELRTLRASVLRRGEQGQHTEHAQKSRGVFYANQYIEMKSAERESYRKRLFMRTTSKRLDEMQQEMMRLGYFKETAEFIQAREEHSSGNTSIKPKA